MTFSKFVLNTVFGIAASAGASLAHGNLITGDLWHVSDAVARNAIPANVPGTTPDVTFDVNSPLNFTTPGTVQTFLNSGGAFNFVENTPGTLASTLSNGVTSTIISFQGVVTVTNGEKFTVAHDDGLTLIIGGIDLGFNPGPTAPTLSTATYTGPTGTFPFQLVYGECCAGQAVLRVDLPFSNPGARAEHHCDTWHRGPYEPWTEPRQAVALDHCRGQITTPASARLPFHQGDRKSKLVVSARTNYARAPSLAAVLDTGA